MGTMAGLGWAQRKAARDAGRDVRKDPCLRCATPHVGMSLFCESHAAEYQALATLAKENGFQPSDIDACEKFAQRTYWPPEALA
jgi:hypothetical protein